MFEIYQKFMDIDYLKSHNEMIHYFGLGFIQLKIDRYHRMHFYNLAKLPPITPEEDVHNHRYNFVSTILKGDFYQEIYRPIEGRNFILEKESCKAGVEVSEPGRECNIERISSHRYPAGSEYYIDHSVFHKVKAENCITFISRSDYMKDLAEVIRWKNSEKICPFSQKIPENLLWGIVEEMLLA